MSTKKSAIFRPSETVKIMFDVEIDDHGKITIASTAGDVEDWLIYEDRGHRFLALPDAIVRAIVELHDENQPDQP